MQVDEREVHIGVNLRRSQVYAWDSVVHLLPQGYQLLLMTFNGLIDKFIVGEPHQMVPPF